MERVWNAGASGGALAWPPWGFFSHPAVLIWPLSPVLEALSVLVNRPDLRQPIRLELADLLAENPERFNSEAREFTLKYGADRPS